MVEGRDRRVEPGRRVEDHGGVRQRRDHQAVPVREHLVVPAGALPARAALQQQRAQPGEAGLVGHLVGLRRGQPVEDGLAFPVAAPRDVVDGLEVGGVGAESLVDLALVPDVEPALLALGIGVQRAREGALAGAHLAQHPSHRLGGAGGEERLARVLPDMAEQVEKLGVIVEHLLEVGREPALVGGVAREAAAQMVVDAALAHPLHGEHDGGLHQHGAGIAVAAPEQLQHGTLRELRRAADAAVAAVDLAQQSPRHVLDLCVRDGLAGLAAGEALQGFHQGCSIFVHLVAVGAVGLLDQLQHLLEAGAAEARLEREVGAAPEGLGVGRQEHGERPAPLLAHQRERPLVDGVEVGALLAIHLDVDEEPVHQGGGLVVLEALVGHDVAPVAGGIAHRQQDGLVPPPSPRPGPPAPRGASGRGSRRAAAGRGWSRRPTGSRSWPFPSGSGRARRWAGRPRARA